MEALLVTNDLDSHRLASAMAPTVKNVPEETLPEDAGDLVAVGEMVARDDLVIAMLIVASLLTVSAVVVGRAAVEDLQALVTREIRGLAAS